MSHNLLLYCQVQELQSKSQADKLTQSLGDVLRAPIFEVDKRKIEKTWIFQTISSLLYDGVVLHIHIQAILSKFAGEYHARGSERFMQVI